MDGHVQADTICPFKVRNSVGLPCGFDCGEPNEDGLINCAIARLDDMNERYLHYRSEFESKRIGDFPPEINLEPYGNNNVGKKAKVS